MATKYELRDNHNPTWRGARSNSLERAQRDLATAVGTVGRWSIIERATKTVLATK